MRETNVFRHQCPAAIRRTRHHSSNVAIGAENSLFEVLCSWRLSALRKGASGLTRVISLMIGARFVRREALRRDFRDMEQKERYADEQRRVVRGLKVFFRDGIILGG